MHVETWYISNKNGSFGDCVGGVVVVDVYPVVVVGC